MTRYHVRSASPLRRACALSLLALGGPAHAYAHDPPEVSRIAWAPDAPAASSVVFQTERGFIVGDTSTRSYRWACVEALDVKLGEHPGFVLLPNNTWLVATEHGLLSSTDQGCSWTAAPRFDGAVTSALALAPDDTQHVYVTVAAAADGGLFESRDAGKTWQKRLHLAPDDYVAQIAIAASDSARIYLNGLVIDEQSDKFSFQLTRSSDGGASWDRAYVPLGPDEDQAVLAALSPVNPDALVVLARNHRWGEQPDRALYSTDAGASYMEIARGIKLTAATFGADGQHILLAGGESLSRIELSGATEPVGMSQMLSCAQPGPAGLYACGHVNVYDPKVYGAALSTDDGLTWQSLMAFTEVKQQVACSHDAVAQRCKDQWLDWQLEILVGMGGAPIDSVEGWMDFRGIEEVPRPAPAHTLSTARRTSPTATAGAAADGDAGAAAMSSRADAAAHTHDARKAQSSGCESTTMGAASGCAWYVLALVCLGMHRVRRARGLVTSREENRSACGS